MNLIFFSIFTSLYVTLYVSKLGRVPIKASASHYRSVRLTPKADIHQRGLHVRLVPEADLQSLLGADCGRLKGEKKWRVPPRRSLAEDERAPTEAGLRIGGNDRDGEAVMAVDANSLKRGDTHFGFGCHEIVESA
jgi:hypothetical protein